MKTFVYLLIKQADYVTGPQERLMSFCNYYRRSAQEKLKISVIAQAQESQFRKDLIQTVTGTKNHTCLVNLTKED